MLTIDHRFALGSPMRPSAPDKKSISNACWPIFACSSLISGCKAFVPSPPNASAAPSSSCVFHCVTCVGCTSKRSAISITVCCALIASNATLALNVAEWLRLDLLLIAALQIRRYLRLKEQSRHLSCCSKGRDHLTNRKAQATQYFVLWLGALSGQC